MLSGRTRLLGVIGHPIGHSLSPRMHNAAFAQDGTRPAGADYVYVAMDVMPDRLPAAVWGLAVLRFVGFNVTMPHKEAILPLMDELDTPTCLAGAVNTVVAEEGKLRGLNTDGSGFVEACEEAGVSLAGRRVLILGAGGQPPPSPSRLWARALHGSASPTGLPDGPRHCGRSSRRLYPKTRF